MSRKRAASPSLIDDFDDEFCENSCSSGKYQTFGSRFFANENIENHYKCANKCLNFNWFNQVQKAMEIRCPFNVMRPMRENALGCVCCPVHFVA